MSKQGNLSSKYLITYVGKTVDLFSYLVFLCLVILAFCIPNVCGLLQLRSCVETFYDVSLLVAIVYDSQMRVIGLYQDEENRVITVPKGTGQVRRPSG